MFHFFNIRSATIRVSSNSPVSDAGAISNHQKLVWAEAELRRTAYRQTSIKTDESFFDNSDMYGDYFLVIIYHKKTFKPLLSARYYFDKPAIARCLKGESNNEIPLPLNKYSDDEIFLIDRMSANLSSVLYRKYRSYIHQLFYLELLGRTRKCKIVAMARSEKNEKLLASYHRLGLDVIGSVMHKNKEHWILFGEMNRLYKQLKTSVVQRNILLFKSFFKI